MDVQTIIRLLDAGYTKQDIEALNIEKPADAPAVPIESIGSSPIEPLKGAESSGAVESAEPEAAGPSNNSEVDALKNIVKGLTDQLAALSATVHKNNIINSEQPEQPAQETAADILAKLINPYYKKEK